MSDVCIDSLCPGVPEFSSLHGHCPLPDVSSPLPTSTPCQCLSQSCLQAFRSQAIEFVQTCHRYRLQLLLVGVAGHGDVGLAEVALGALLPLLPPVPLLAHVPAEHGADAQLPDDRHHGEAGGDIPDASSN